jgi:squalene cyclase
MAWPTAASEVTLRQAVAIGGDGLISLQNANGSWGSGQAPLYRDSSAALQALRSLGLQGQAAYTEGVGYLSGLAGADYDLTARKLLGLIQSGQGLSSLQNSLNSGWLDTTASVDGQIFNARGWPYEADSYENILDTAVSYRALIESGAALTNNEHLLIQVYIKGRQLADGGWNFSGNDAGDVFVTATVMQTMAKAPNINSSLYTAALTQSRDFLLVRQNANGSWGNAPGLPGETAMAALALQSAGERLNDNSAKNSIDRAGDWLRSHQLIDGTWARTSSDPTDYLADGEAFNTAVALQFLQVQAAQSPTPTETPETPTPTPLPTSGPVAEGLAFVKGAQQGDGSWQGGSPANRSGLVVTGMVLEGFAALGLNQQAEFAQGADYLAGQTGTTPAQLAWQIIGLANAGRSTGTLRTALNALCRTDGTGGAVGSGSPTASYETALELRALRVAGNAANGELDALKTLLRRRRANGSFAADGSAFSEIEVTGQVLELLDELSDVYIVGPFVDEIVAYLKSAQNADGGWGSGSSNTFDTAYALGLLIAAGDLPANPSGAVDYLLNSQGGDGSWSSRAEDTVYAIRALQSTQPDLTVVAGSLGFSNTSPSAGDVVSVSAEVRNIGLLASGAFQARFYDGNPAYGGVGIGDPIPVSSLAPGASAIVTVSWNTASSGGSREIFCVADSGAAVTESNEGNNAASASIFVLADTDLVITPSDITFNPTSPVEGDDVSMRIRIRNEGREAQNVLVHIYEGTRFVTGGIFPVIGERQQVIFTIPLRGLRQGKHDFRVVVDPNNTIQEGNESNNEAIGSIRISVRRDLSITAQDIAFVPGNPLMGDQVTVTAVVHNEGDDSSDNVVVQFFRGNPETGAFNWAAPRRLRRCLLMEAPRLR